MVKNVARILQVAHRLDVPFYLGSDEPLLGEPIDAAFVSPQRSSKFTFFFHPMHAIMSAAARYCNVISVVAGRETVSLLS